MMNNQTQPRLIVQWSHHFRYSLISMMNHQAQERLILQWAQPFSASIDLNDEPPGTTTPPSPMATQLQMVTPSTASDDGNDKTPNTTHLLLK